MEVRAFKTLSHLCWVQTFKYNICSGKKEQQGPLSKIHSQYDRSWNEKENLLQYVKEDTAICIVNQGSEKELLRKYNYLGLESVVRLIDVTINSFIHVDAPRIVIMAAKTAGDDRLFSRFEVNIPKHLTIKKYIIKGGKTRIHMSPSKSFLCL